MTAEEVATVLGVSVGRVRQLASKGAIKCEKVGRDWIFKSNDVADYARRPRRPGRPNKT